MIGAAKGDFNWATILSQINLVIKSLPKTLHEQSFGVGDEV